MYLAFWIRPEAKQANKRLVVCKPLLDAPSAAWTVLQSAIHEKRTGGILAGGQEELESCVRAMESDDQRWPDDPDRMVAAITTIAKEQGCTVVFRQNLAPKFAKTWAVLDGCGVFCELEQDSGGSWYGNVMGPEAAIDTVASVLPGVTRVLPTSLLVKMEEDVVTARATRKTELGESYEIRLPLDRVEDILDCALGPDSLGYQFCLLIKDRAPRSIVFFGSKVTQTINQAIDHYVTHLAGDEDPEVVEDTIRRPPVGQCRFWKLRHR